jgi:hypothetical protein
MNEWNAVITKVRQEFYIRGAKTRPQIDGCGVDEYHVRKSFNDNRQFFNVLTDYVLKSDVLKLYHDIRALLCFEVPSTDSYNNPRLPEAYITANYKGGPVDSFWQRNHELDALSSEGSRVADNWWDGGKMHQYIYRFAHGNPPLSGDDFNHPERYSLTDSQVHSAWEYGYADVSALPDINVQDATFNPPYRPRGNYDYLDGSLSFSGGTWATSDAYRQVMELKKDFLHNAHNIHCDFTTIEGYDSYGNAIRSREEKEIPMQLIYALTQKTYNYGGKDWEISISAQNINDYFFKAINHLAAICVCNCNYCSCYGHEASCICYVVKVNGWCYSYQYDYNGSTFNSPELCEG